MNSNLRNAKNSYLKGEGELGYLLELIKMEYSGLIENEAHKKPEGLVKVKGLKEILQELIDEKPELSNETIEVADDINKAITIGNIVKAIKDF